MRTRHAREPQSTIAPPAGAPATVMRARVAILGCDRAGPDFRAAIRSAESLIVAALQGGDSHVQRLWARDLGYAAPIYAELDPALATGLTLDGLIVVSGAADRAAALRAAIARGLPALCPMPYAEDIAGAEGLCATAEQSHVLLMPVAPHRLDPLYCRVAAILDADDGTACHARCRLGVPSTPASARGIEGQDTIEAAVLRATDVFRWWFADAKTVSADLAPARTGAGIERADVITQHARGAATIHAGLIKGMLPVEHYSVENGKRRIDLVIAAGGTSPAAQAPSLRVVPPAEGADSIPPEYPSPDGALPDSVELMRRMLAHFVDCVLRHTPPRATAADALNGMRVLEAARLSAVEGHKVAMLGANGDSGAGPHGSGVG